LGWLVKERFESHVQRRRARPFRLVIHRSMVPDDVNRYPPTVDAHGNLVSDAASRSGADIFGLPPQWPNND